MKRNLELSDSGKRLLADRLNELLVERGMSLRDLADKSGVGMGTVNGIGQGTREPYLSALLAFVRALELRSLEELLAPLGTQIFLGVEDQGPT